MTVWGITPIRALMGVFSFPKAEPKTKKVSENTKFCVQCVISFWHTT